MNYSLAEITEKVSYWANKPDSLQKTIVLNQWISEAQKYITYSRTYSRKVYNNNGYNLVGNTGEERKQAIRLVAGVLGVPMKKQGENLQSQMSRLTQLRLV